jgi:hypothetical protein
MIFEKLGSLALFGLAKKAALVAVAVPALAVDAVPEAAVATQDLADEPPEGAGENSFDDDLSDVERSRIVSSLHEEAVASLDLAAADLAELKNELAGLGEASSRLV